MKNNTKRNCHSCTKKIVSHKLNLQCDLCENYYHTKCALLKRNDVEFLKSSDLLETWSCFKCIENILPINAAPETTLLNVKIASKRNTCNGCGKNGRISMMEICWICDNLVHRRCSSGKLGCMGCMAEIFPGFKSNTKELFNTQRKNREIFNPYHRNHESNYVGEVLDDGNYDFNPWDTCSGILNQCKYFEKRAINRSKPHELQIYSNNIRSIVKNFDHIRDQIEFYSKFDVLCFNETNCDFEDLPFKGDEMQLLNFHPPFFQKPARKSNKGGGLITYVKKDLCNLSDISIKEELSFNDDPKFGEFLTLEIKFKRRKNVIICNYYRSPSGIVSSFLEKFNALHSKLTRHKNKILFLMGDGNINLLEYGKFDGTTNFVDKMNEHNLAPIISRPTRITSHTATLIDHIFTNSCQSVTRSGVISESISDHLATFVCILMDPKKENCKLQNEDIGSQSRLINEGTIENFESEMKLIDWSFLYRISDANSKYTAFSEKYQEIYERNFPIIKKKMSRRKHPKPWILEWLQCACDRKNRLYQNFVKTPSAENEEKYKKMKKFVEKHVKIAKSKYYKSYFNRYSGDSRKQWQMVNSLLNRKTKQKIKINKICHNDQEVTDNQGIANSFNNYFSNIAQQLKDQIPHTKLPQRHSINSARCNVDMEFQDTSPSEIYEIMKSLKEKATLDSAIKPLKRVKHLLAPVLNHVISSSLKQGVFPDKLKIAKVIPLYKGGSRSDVKNYRPISLLSSFSKIFEKIMQSRLVRHLTLNNILYASQYGFRAGHSCEHAILEAQSSIIKSLERKQVTALLLLDFSKAFDMVDHGILLKKLEHYGIRDINLKMFETYLKGRSQYVHINSSDSATADMRHGVPQGSILGPILFILYINDLPGVNSTAKYIFFADDANIIISADSYTELNMLANNVLESVQSWVGTNGLKLNVGKTKYMVFANKKKSEIDIQLNGQRLKESEHERFLGVILDSKLNWKHHIMYLSTKISRNAGILYKLKGIVPDKVMKMLYNSFIQSHLYYCATVWGLGSLSSINRLFSAQKKAIRATDRKFHNIRYDKNTGEAPSHTKDIFKNLGILALPNLIAKSTLCLLQKTRIKVTPANIEELFQTGHEKLAKTRSENDFFNVPKFRLSKSDKSIAFAGPKLYNKVVKEINIELQALNPPTRLENKFMNAFKGHVEKYLMKVQNSDENKFWNSNNFTLHK